MVSTPNPPPGVGQVLKTGLLASNNLKFPNESLNENIRFML